MKLVEWILMLLTFLSSMIVILYSLQLIYTTRRCPWIVVKIPGQGIVLGNFDNTAWTKQTILQFRGIPYAEAPSGSLRFKAPIPKLPWTARYVDATQIGRSCPAIQTISKPLDNGDLEDCLNLCVYTKMLNSNQPVILYVYGGGFYNGTALDYPPKYLLQKNIVLVVPHFRTGALGWASTSSKQFPGNMSLLDLQLVLHWIQKYISTFGGNPGQVTVMGQSGGACMAGALMLSPLTNDNYIKQIIMMSGSVLSSWAINKYPRQQLERICGKLNCTNCRKHSHLAVCLNDAKITDILEASKYEFFSPVVGDFHGVLPEQPLELMRKFKNHIPVLTGFTKHDGSFAVAMYYDKLHRVNCRFSDLTVQQFSNGLINIINYHNGILSNRLSSLLFPQEVLRSNNHVGAIPAYIDLASIEFMKSAVLAVASYLEEKKLAPVYLYSFDYEGQHTRFGYGFSTKHYPFNGGVHHSDDIIYLFSTHTLNKADTKLAKKMIELWTSFAMTGKPSLDKDTKILAMTNATGPYFSIQKEIEIKSNALQELTAASDDSSKNKLIRKNKSF